MAARGVSLLKFVGTVSLGLLTGLSYTLSTLTIPTLLTLPSASAAAKAFETLTTTARRHLSSLTSLSATAFGLAYLFSPRTYRHPYLLYTSLLVLGSQLVVSDLVAPYILSLPASSSSSSSQSAAGAAARKQQQQKAKDAAAARARMEASYEVLSSPAHSEGSVSGGEDAVELDNATDETNSMNGEEVRVKVEAFLKKQMVQSAVAGLAFMLSVVGIWGDGVVAPVYGHAIVIEV
ncbi:hypothetical protein B0H63DRAFT_557538 [Podospora didyma]|uniref:Autophagy-related protein 33 n=1 Tax=Podospora didyma TaxID=330526 RepID=A0AAE0NZM4_9PEZI|nr:hypothetical protein B0H63DRAFT_557538 [Podospora didyma]